MKIHRIVLLALVAAAASACATVHEDRYAPHPTFASVPDVGTIGDARDVDTRDDRP